MKYVNRVVPQDLRFATNLTLMYWHRYVMIETVILWLSYEYVSTIWYVVLQNENGLGYREDISFHFYRLLSSLHDLPYYPPGQTPDSKDHVANMGLTWGQQDPGGPHVGHMNLIIWYCLQPRANIKIELRFCISKAWSSIKDWCSGTVSWNVLVCRHLVK